MLDRFGTLYMIVRIDENDGEDDNIDERNEHENGRNDNGEHENGTDEGMEDIATRSGRLRKHLRTDVYLATEDEYN